MNVIELILKVAFCGFLVWLICLIPMKEVFRTVIYGIACFALVIFLLQAFGLIGGHFLKLR